MFCALSGVVPQEPVVSSKSGHLFEKRLVLSKLEQSGNKCPITGQDLLPTDLVNIQVASGGSAPPRMASSSTNATTSGASIPAMLQVFRDEWDAVVLESHTLRSTLLDTRQQLSVALYEKDAARRVIATLLKEREELKRMIVDGTSNGVAPMEIDTHTSSSSSSPSFSNGPVTVQSLEEATTFLSQARAKRKKQSNWLSNDAMKTFAETASRSPHKSSAKGILSLKVHPIANEELVLSGGVDCQGKILSTSSYKVQGTLSGHSGSVNCVDFTPIGFAPITASEDGTVKIWESSVKKSMKCVSTLSGHQGSINSLSLHSSVPLCLTASQADGTWRTWDYGVGSDLMRCSGGASGITGVQHAELHPDGILVVGGVNTCDGQTNGIVMWDLRQQSSQNGTVLGYSNGKMTSMSFSVNGYNAASGNNLGVVHIWDLRKAGKGVNQAIVCNINVDECCHSVKYDNAGKYLAACSNSGVDVYAHKKWTGPLVSLNTHSDVVKCVDFTNFSSAVITGSMDRTMKFWSAN
jgi:pre-mRNA-processing factor 19